jgi:hypothetical protein
MNNTQTMEVTDYTVPVQREDQNSDVNIYRAIMKKVLSMYPETITVNRILNQYQRSVVERLLTGAVMMKDLAGKAISKFNEKIKDITQWTAKKEAWGIIQIESQITKYLEDNNCVYVLGCEELEHERPLYDDDSFNQYMSDCLALNLWTASGDNYVVNLANEAFKAHYASMGRTGENQATPPTRIGILLFLIELSFTGVPSYELAPSTHPFTSMVEKLYGAVVKERVELVNQYLAHNLDVEFDDSGNVAKIKPMVGPTGREPVNYGLTGTLYEIDKDYPVLGSMEQQIAAQTEGMDALKTFETVGRWEPGRKIVKEKLDKEGKELLGRMDKRSKSKKRKITGDINSLRGLSSDRSSSVMQHESLGGKRTHKRSKKHGKTHKKHRKANKKHSRRRGRK